MSKGGSIIATTILFLGLVLYSTQSVFASVSSEHNIIRGADGVIYISTELNDTQELSNIPSNLKSNQTPAPSQIDQTKPSPATPSATPNSTRKIKGVKPITMPEGFFANITTLINGLLRVVFLIATLLTFLFLLRGGFSWITSGGDRGKLESARSTILAAVIGLIIVSASYAILTIVIQLIGFNSLEQVFQQGLTRQ